MIVGALRHARRTGLGQWIDLGQTLTSAALTDTAVIEYTVNGDIHAVEMTSGAQFLLKMSLSLSHWPQPLDNPN